MLTKSGAKLLDFGLAKMRPLAAAAEHTVTMTVTTEGSIVGTFQYMSPEQLDGREADSRSDIFAFGATFYEMLTGKRAFEGKSHASLIAAIMSAEPAPLSTVQPMAPVALDRVVRRCLVKEPDDRWQTARDLREELVWIQEGGSQASAPTAIMRPTKPQPWLAWAAAGLFALATLVLVVVLFRQEKPTPRPLRFSVSLPEGASFSSFIRPSISPDGEKILFAGGVGGQERMYLHNLVTGETQPVAGLDGGGNAFWSFDSRAFLVTRGNSLVRVNAGGGLVQPLPLPFNIVDATVANLGYSSWGPQGIVTSANGTLQWYQHDGSGVRVLRAPRADEFALRFPTLIPGGRWVMYNISNVASAVAAPNSVRLVSVDGAIERTLFTADSSAVYADPGYVLYLRGSTLMARPLDPRSAQLRGEAEPVVDGVLPGIAAQGTFSASANGVLVYRSGTLYMGQLIWLDRAGKPLGSIGGLASYTNPALSPDGRRLAVGIQQPTEAGRDIWVFDLDSGTPSKLTFDPEDELNPVWSPDGSRIAFSSNRKGARNLYVKSSSGVGDADLLLESGLNKSIEDWSRDGRTLLYNQQVPGSSNDIWMFSFDTRQPQPFVQTPFTEDHAKFSPDGKWVAYRSLESGRAEVYVQPFTGQSARGKWVLSSGGGQEPQWRADGKELFYATLENPARIMAVDIVEKDGAIVHGTPHVLFETRLTSGGRNRWVVTPDGKRFLAIVPPEEKAATTFNVIVNWPSLLRK
jgi:Tol biopolymer transport system component